MSNLIKPFSQTIFPHLGSGEIWILGLGLSGLAAAKWLQAHGFHHIRVLDDSTEPERQPELKESCPHALFESHPIAQVFSHPQLSRCKVFIVSPGMMVDESFKKGAKQRKITLSSEIGLFLGGLAFYDTHSAQKIIAITGTNGKTTTTELVAHLLRSNGHDAICAGNIAPAALDMLRQRLISQTLPSYWVLELSSFQLDLIDAIECQAATILNVTEDHLDRHVSFENYTKIKSKIFLKSHYAIIDHDNKTIQALASKNQNIIYFGSGLPQTNHDFGLITKQARSFLSKGIMPLLPSSSLPLIGEHNVKNMLAALALCACVDASIATPEKASHLLSFKSLPDRVELAGEINQVKWYNDSKATNVGATMAAIDDLYQTHSPLIVLIGGQGKQQDFSVLREILPKVSHIVLFGEGAQLIRTALPQNCNNISMSTSLDSAIKIAQKLCTPGSTVLLSPACASFDEFKNYAHRGRFFTEQVQAMRTQKQNMLFDQEVSNQ